VYVGSLAVRMTTTGPETAAVGISDALDVVNGLFVLCRLNDVDMSSATLEF